MGGVVASSVEVVTFIVRMSTDSDNHPDNIRAPWSNVVVWAGRRHTRGGVADRTG